MRTSFVTGAGGFVGGAVAEALMSRGDRVICLTLGKRPLDHRPSLSRAVWHYGSVTDGSLVQDIIARYEPQEVYHYAASSQVKSGQRDPSGTIELNVIGTRSVLEACRISGGVGSILVASSDKAYGEPDHPVREEDGLFPRHMYDATKAAGDLIAQAYAVDFDMPIIITRSCNIYGPGDLNWGRVFPGVLQRLASGQAPVIYQGAEAMEREFVFIDDYVEAALHLSSRIHTLKDHIFNVGTGEVVNVASLIRDIITASGLGIKPEFKAAGFKELTSQSVHSERLRATGWSPIINLDTGTHLTAQWYLNFLKGGQQ